MKTVVIVNDYANSSGGSNKMAVETAIALKNHNYNVIFFSAVGPISEDLKNTGIDIYCLNQKDIFHEKKYKAVIKGVWNRSSYVELKKILDRLEKKDTIVHVHGWSKALTSSVIKATIDSNIKAVITLHDYFFVCPNGGLFDYKRHKNCSCTPMSYKCCMLNCDKRSSLQKKWRVCRQIVQNKYIRDNENLSFITISGFNNDIANKYLKSKKIFRLNNIVETINEFDKTECDNTYIYVGRISEEKGTDIFCEAIQQMNDAGVAIHGAVIGDGPEINYYRKNYPKVEFSGWKNAEELYSIICRARYLVLPSRCHEGAPLSIVEALQLGVPCIVSNCTTATEIINDKNGFHFKAENIDDLKKVLLRSMDNSIYSKHKKYTLDNLSLYRKQYASDYHIKQLGDIYENILYGDENGTN